MANFVSVATIKTNEYEEVVKSELSIWIETRSSRYLALAIYYVLFQNQQIELSNSALCEDWIVFFIIDRVR